MVYLVVFPWIGTLWRAEDLRPLPAVLALLALSNFVAALTSLAPVARGVCGGLCLGGRLKARPA
jgi:hypothetical protein